MNVCVMCKREYEPFISRHHWAPSMCPECAEKYNQEKRILDSGERTTFSTGAQRDMHSGKGRMGLLPWAAIIEVSKHCEAGALKYGTHNVDKGIPTSSLMDSAMRHAAKYLDGQEDEDHLLAAAWNLLWAVQMRCKNPKCVDTPWSKERQGGADT